VGLLEGLVFGSHAGRGAAEAARNMPDDFRAPPLANPPGSAVGDLLDLADIRNSLKSLMWRAAGVRRERERLASAAESIDRWCHYVLPRQFKNPEGWELQNMLVVARLIIAAALRREESRGVHLRTDFPQADGGWNRRIGSRRQESGECLAI
jgi:L-aspartate oxidase